MSTIPFYSSPRARFFDNNGKPLSNGRVSFYFANTSTLKQVYTDNTTTTPAQNPQLLDSEGYVRDGGVWLGSGTYKVVLEGSDGAGGYVEEWSMDNIPGSKLESNNIIGDVTYVKTVSDMVSLPANEFGAVYVFGYYTENDGGQGWFLWDNTSAESPDDGYIFAPAGVPAQGRWYRNFEDDHISVTQWGATESASGAVNANLNNCINYANSISAIHNNIIVPTGVYELNGDVVFGGTDISVTFETGASFKSNSYYSVTISCADAQVNGLHSLIDEYLTLNWLPISKRDAYAEYWGAGVSVTNVDDRAAMNRILCSGKVIFSNNYSTNHTLAGPPGAFTVERAYFKTGAILNIAGNNPNITFDDITYDNDASEIFQSTTGLYNQLRFNSAEIPIRLFKEHVLSDATYYENFIIAITNNNIKTGIIIWDTPELVATSVTYTNVNWRLQSKFINGCILRTLSNLYIGANISGPVHCLDSTSPSEPIINGTSFLLHWWNPLQTPDSTSNTNTNNALITAHKTQVYSATFFTDMYATIDGMGGSFYYNETITINATNKPLKIKNIELIQLTLPTLTQSGFVCNTNIIASNLRWYTNVNKVLIFSSDDSKFNNSLFNEKGTVLNTTFDFGIDVAPFTSYDGSITFNNCEFEQLNKQFQLILFSGPDQVVVNNCTANRASPFVAKGNTQGYINGCNFNGALSTPSQFFGRWQFSNTSIIGGKLEVYANENFNGFTSFNACNFDKAIDVKTTGTNNLTNLKITNCSFKNSNNTDIPHIRLMADESGTKICNGVVITNNMFDYQSIVATVPWSGEIIKMGAKNEDSLLIYYYGSYEVGNIGGDTSNYVALTGHKRCNIVDNICKGDAVYAGTNQNYQLRENSNAVNSNYILSNPFDAPGRQNIPLIGTYGMTEAILLADDVPISAYVYGRQNVKPFTNYQTDNWVAATAPSILMADLTVIGAPGSPFRVPSINFGGEARTELSQIVKVDWNSASTDEDPDWISIP